MYTIVVLNSIDKTTRENELFIIGIIAIHLSFGSLYYIEQRNIIGNFKHSKLPYSLCLKPREGLQIH